MPGIVPVIKSYLYEKIILVGLSLMALILQYLSNVILVGLNFNYILSQIYAVFIH